MGIKLLPIQRIGFTLIEIIMVMGILAMLMPTVFSVVFIIMNQQLKIHRLTETKRQGDLIMTNIKESIARDAIRIVDSTGVAQCNVGLASFNSTMGNMHFILNTNTPPNKFAFRLFGGSMHYEFYTYNFLLNMYNWPQWSSLNTSATVQVSNFFMECLKRDDTSYPIVGFSYDISYFDPTPTVEEGDVILHYQTKVKLRAAQLN